MRLAWFIIIGLALILMAMIGRFATAGVSKPAPRPEPIESLIPAICIERDEEGKVTPCQT